MGFKKFQDQGGGGVLGLIGFKYSLISWKVLYQNTMYTTPFCNNKNLLTFHKSPTSIMKIFQA